MAVTAPIARTTTVVSSDIAPTHYLEWGPIILGALGALAIIVVLMTFGAALGLTVVSPQPYAGLSAKALAVLAGLYAALVHVASFGAGGYLAGRMRTPWTAGDLVEQHFRDGGHGFAVWALGVVLGAGLVLSGASLIGRLGSSTFRLFITAVSMSPAGSCFSSESAPRPFHHGSRGRGGTIYRSALPSEWRWVQATERTHLIHRPAGDIIPPLGGARVFSYRI